MRVLDITIGIILLAIFFIPFIIIGILVKVTSKGPILYWSDRIGIYNSIFKMPKFRSMRINTPEVATHLLKEKDYLTSIGRFLRVTSIDELPQILSVIKGDMSFVGPRPALFNQDDLKELRTRNNIHTLKPGITGWAQINGRDELSINEKIKFDIEYIEKKSILFYFKILLLTVIKVLSRKNISH